MAEDALSPEERAYFDSRGEKNIPAPAETPVTPEPTPREAGEAGISSAPPTEATAESSAPVEADAGKVTDTQLRGALAEERKRRKELDERLRQSELMQARMEERWKTFTERPPQAPVAPKSPPRPDQDIFGAVDHTMRALDGVTRKITEYEQNERNKLAAQQLTDWARSHEQAFLKDNPDYYDALNHLRSRRWAQLEALRMEPIGIRKQLENEEQQLLTHASRMRISPAQIAYDLAKTNGYTKRAAAPPSDPAAQLDRVEAGQRASGSLSAVGGKSGNGVEVTLADLAKMSDKDFDAFRQTKPAQYRRLKGAEH